MWLIKVVVCLLDALWVKLFAAINGVSLAHANQLPLLRLQSTSGYKSDLCQHHYRVFH